MPSRMGNSQPANPYKPGTLYSLIFALLTGPRRLTREELSTLAAAASGDTVKTVDLSVWVVISPRKTDEHGDSRGNSAAKGHLYYVETSRDGKLHAFPRVPPMEPRGRPSRQHDT